MRRALFVLTLALASLHGWCLWASMGGYAGITNGWVPWRDDYPLYFHSALVTRHFLAQTGTTAGYDPAFMSGYAKSVVFPASSTLPELVVTLFGGSRPELAYKIYIFIGAAITPWLILAAAYLWRCGTGGTFLAVTFYLLYVWTGFPLSYVAFGMIPYFLAIPLGLVATGAFARYCERGGFAWWLVSASLMVFVVLVHFTSAMVVVPAAAAVYVASLSKPQDQGVRTVFTRPRHFGVWSIPVLVIFLNAFWWLPGIWLASTKGDSGFAFSHPEGVLVRLLKITDPKLRAELMLCLAGLPSLLFLLRRERASAVGLLMFVASGFFWGYQAGQFRSLDFLQPGRHTYAFFTGLSVAAGFGLSQALGWLKNRLRWRLDIPVALGLFALAAWVFEPFLEPHAIALFEGKAVFLASSPPPRILRIIRTLKRITKPGDRVYYEEGGIDLQGIPDPFSGGRISGLLPWKLGVEVIGGPYLHASLQTNFTQFGEGKLFEESQYDRAWFERYAKLYRPSAIVCWTPRARALCLSRKDLFQLVDDDGFVLIAKVKGFEGAAISGKAVVEASPGRLRVSGLEGGVDGTVVLRYHSVPCLRTDPPVAMEPVFLEDDPVPFIRLRPPPGVATIELRFPPTTTRGPVR